MSEEKEERPLAWSDVAPEFQEEYDLDITVEEAARVIKEIRSATPEG